MKTLIITTFALTLVIASAAVAATTTSKSTTTTTTTTTTAAKPAPSVAQLAAAEPAAGKKKHNKKKHKRQARPAAVQGESYTEMRVGDPRIVYHGIGTSGAQNGNTIIPFHDEPIRSSKPYEIRYDYAEFRGDAR